MGGAIAHSRGEWPFAPTEIINYQLSIINYQLNMVGATQEWLPRLFFCTLLTL